MAVITANTGAGNYNVNGTWVGGVQPDATSDVVIPATAVVTIPTGITALARSVTIAATATLAFATNTSVLTLGDATTGAGNVIFSNAGTITLTGVGVINLNSSSATQQTIATGGQSLGRVNSASGSYKFLDAMTVTGVWGFSGSALDTNGKILTMTGANPTFNGGGITYYEVDITGSGIFALNG